MQGKGGRFQGMCAFKTSALLLAESGTHWLHDKRIPTNAAANWEVRAHA